MENKVPCFHDDLKQIMIVSNVMTIFNNNKSFVIANYITIINMTIMPVTYAYGSNNYRVVSTNDKMNY